MGAAEIFATIAAAIQAVPIINGWFQQLIAAWMANQNKETMSGIVDAASFAARATNQEERFAASEKWRKALSRSRVIASLLIIFVLSGCRTDNPPVLSLICTLDGLGGADCVTGQGDRKYLAPSETVNMWATTQTDQANFAAWCYGVSPKTANAALESIKKNGIDP